MVSGPGAKGPTTDIRPNFDSETPFRPSASTPANGRETGIMGRLLEFRDESLEREFRTQFVVSQLQHIRIAVVAAVFLMIGFGLIDALLYGDEINHLRAWSMRLLFFTPMAAAFIAFTHSDTYIEYAQIIGLCCIFIVGSTWSIMTSDAVHRSLFLLPNLVESSIYSLFFLGLTLKYSIPATDFLCLLYAILLYGLDLSSKMNVAIVFSVIGILGLMTLCAYQRETIARTLFLKNKDEQQAARRHILENQRDLEWFRGLAAFLRHEVRQPVALVSSSLDIMQLSKPKEDIVRQIHNAETGVRHVWSLIDRATRATDVEAFIRQSKAQMIDVALLIDRLVEEYRQTYSGVRFVFDQASIKPILLYVDPELFREAVGNLLSNAASFADDGSDVVIALTRSTDAVSLTVANKGPAIDGDIESLFSPFRSTRAGADNDHQGLGLYLVRLVAQHYGGTAVLENRQEQGGVAALLNIPIRMSGDTR